jgi:hypothetical protein
MCLADSWDRHHGRPFAHRQNVCTVRWHTALSLHHRRPRLSVGGEFRSGETCFAHRNRTTVRGSTVPVIAYQFIPWTALVWLGLATFVECCPNTSTASCRKINCVINTKAAGYGNLPVEHYCYLTVFFKHLMAVWQYVFKIWGILIGKLSVTQHWRVA